MEVIDRKLARDKIGSMSSATPAADPELEIWERVFVPDSQHLTPSQAQYLLDVRFPQSDLDRINALSAKAGDGTLTPAEGTVLEH
jgi:hypothetical protein